MRGHYEQRTIAALRKRGALADTPGQPVGGGDKGGVTQQTSFDRGAEIARRFRPSAEVTTA